MNPRDLDYLPRILLVEDNEGDIVLIRNHFDQENVPYEMHMAHDGDEALDFLEKCEELPHLILLDINMPKMDGHALLEALKKSFVYRKIPVLMLTSSRLEKDIEHARTLGANGYVNKPMDATLHDLLGFLDIVRMNPDTWMHVKSE